MPQIEQPVLSAGFEPVTSGSEDIIHLRRKLSLFLFYMTRWKCV